MREREKRGGIQRGTGREKKPLRWHGHTACRDRHAKIQRESKETKALSSWQYSCQHLSLAMLGVRVRVCVCVCPLQCAPSASMAARSLLNVKGSIFVPRESVRVLCTRPANACAYVIPSKCLFVCFFLNARPKPHFLRVFVILTHTRTLSAIQRV